MEVAVDGENAGGGGCIATGPNRVAVSFRSKMFDVCGASAPKWNRPWTQFLPHRLPPSASIGNYFSLLPTWPLICIAAYCC